MPRTSDMHFDEHILTFLQQLDFPGPLPRAVEIMNPFKEAATWQVCTEFYRRYYHDRGTRSLILGINPGRFGGGVTGIPFTDPIRLEQDCSISNSFAKKPELSSVFVYELIHQYGGPEQFYRDFYLSSTSPLGFTRHQKNCNYYDDPKLEQDIRGFVIDCMRKQLSFPIRTRRVFVLGEGKNYRFLSALNEQIHFCDSLIGLPHPRFVMQYQLKQKSKHLSAYLRALGEV